MDRSGVKPRLPAEARIHQIEAPTILVSFPGRTISYLAGLSRWDSSAFFCAAFHSVVRTGERKKPRLGPVAETYPSWTTGFFDLTAYRCLAHRKPKETPEASPLSGPTLGQEATLPHELAKQTLNNSRGERPGPKSRISSRVAGPHIVVVYGSWSGSWGDLLRGS